MTIPESSLNNERLPKEARLFLLAQTIATNTAGFFQKKGPGIGDKASNQFMTQLRSAAQELFGTDYSETKTCRGTKFAFDFYFPDEETVVEVALSLRNPSSEYERDIFKCLLAIDDGCPIRHLVFITKPGGHYRVIIPAGASSIAGYVERKFGIHIEVRELTSAPVDVATALAMVRNQLLAP